MAENKKSFILYADYIHTIKKLPKEKIGELFLTIMAYVNDENPVVEDIMVDLVFEPIKQQLKRDLREWEVIRKGKSESGKLGNLKRWHKDLYEKVINQELTIDEADNIAKCRIATKNVANIAVNVTDNVTVTDNVINNKNSKGDKSPPAKKNFKNFSEKEFVEEIKKYENDFPRDMLNQFFIYWKERSPGGKMKFQLQKTWETKLRLETWKRNELKYQQNGSTKTFGHKNSKSAGAYELAEQLGKELGIIK